MKKVHRYEVSNWTNGYSNQRYPTRILSVKYVDITGPKNPNGMLCVSADDVDGYFCTVLKCYVTAKGKRYCIFGRHRLYEGFSGSVVLVGAPVSVREALKGCGAEIAD